MPHSSPRFPGVPLAGCLGILSFAAPISPVFSEARAQTSASGNASGAARAGARPVESISMDFPEPTPLDAVARHLARAIGANLVVAPNAPRIALVAPRPVGRAEAFALFEAAVDSAGWRVVRAGPVYRVVPAAKR